MSGRTKATREGTGAGWGGPAKGAGNGGKRHANFAPGNQEAVGHTGPGARAARIEALKDHLYLLATTAEKQDTQVRAAEAYLNRVEGTPIARSVVATVDDPTQLADDRLESRIADLLGKAAASGTTH